MLCARAAGSAPAVQQALATGCKCERLPESCALKPQSARVAIWRWPRGPAKRHAAAQLIFGATKA